MGLFNNTELYPTPPEVIAQMLEGEKIAGKTILEPSAGTGNIVDYLQAQGGEVLACETNDDLRTILSHKCKVLEPDFLKVTSDQISHINMIVMNPPFSADEKHISHAYNVAPPGCKIIALCNTATLENTYSQARRELKTIIQQYGISQNLGDCFSNAERQTGVNISLVKIQKPGGGYETEFEGFFLGEEPAEAQSDGLISYNLIRDVVNRYVEAVKIYDSQLEAGERMNRILDGFYGETLAFQCVSDKKPVLRAEFKKDLQKSAWNFIFQKMDFTKNTTKGLKEDINKFVEQQQQIPFTMRNIYHMLDIVFQTTGQRMDKAILEVFDKVTAHHHENRYNLPGWKTNGHFLVGKKFILPYQISPAKEYGFSSETYHSIKNHDGIMSDFEKALCFITGEQYESFTWEKGTYTRTRNGIMTIYSSIGKNKYGEWYECHFFRYKGYKNGNMHFEFRDEKVWENFNKAVARIKGYPLPEYKAQTAYQNRQTGRKETPNKQTKTLFEMSL